MGFQTTSSLFSTFVGMVVVVVGWMPDLQASPGSLSLADSAEAWGTQRGEDLYNFRNENSSSHFLTSHYRGQPVQLHYRHYSAQHAQGEFLPDASTAMIFFPGLRAPEVKHSWVIEKLWHLRSAVDFFVMDVRSHGRSESIQSGNWTSVHVEHYDEFLDDFALFIDHVSQLKEYKNIVVSAHSSAAAMLLMALKEYPEIQQRISKVVLTSPGFRLAPDILPPINNFGRIPITWGAPLGKFLLATGLAKPDSVTLGYPKTYKIFDPDKVRNMIHDKSFYWAYRRWVELEEASGDPYPFQVERTGPSVNWTIEMARAQRNLRRMDLGAVSVPIDIFVASSDSLVDNRAAVDICSRLQNCSLTELEGYHEILFDYPVISEPFFHSLESGVISGATYQCADLLVVGF